MNPFTHILPLTEIKENISFDLYLNHPLENKIQEIIQENNLLTYFSDQERFPNIEYLRKTLKSWEIPYKEFDLTIILWILGFCSLLIPLSFIEKPKTIFDYHFLDSNSITVRNAKNYFLNKIKNLYNELYHKTFSEETLNSIMSINPVFYNFQNQNEFILYLSAKNYFTIITYIAQFENNPNFFLEEEILKRKKIAIETLKKKIRISANEQTISNSELGFPKNRRATDDPRWKQIENSPKIEWETVFKTFGTNIVIRILLRRQDYSLLKEFIQTNMITSEEDLKYILQCMNKILDNKDLKKEKEEEFKNLKNYIQDKIINQK